MTSRRRSEPGPSMSQNEAERLHKTHPGTSTHSPNTSTSIGGNMNENTTYQKSDKTRYTPPLVAFRKRLQSFSKTRVQFDTKIKKLGDRVTDHINGALGRETSLSTLISNASVPTSHPEYQGKRFLPNNKIDELLSVETVVRKAIAKYSKYEKYPQVRRCRDSTPDIEGDVERICSPENINQDENSRVKSYRKIFIILVLLKKAWVITWFIDKGICDDDLPLCRESETGMEGQPMRSSGEPLPMEVLIDGFLDKFIEKQWLVLAPCFRPFDDGAKDDPQVLTGKHIPPFISWRPIGNGGFGEVFEIKIHPGQHMFSHVSNTGVFAVKVLKSRGKQPTNPEREHAILRKFKDNRHDHMISILTAYIQDGVYHLILPRALADLHVYWEKINPNPLKAEADENLAWLATQCQGLAEGLSRIHRYETFSFKCLLNTDSFQIVEQRRSQIKGGSKKALRLFGRHGDIKPKNILYFPRFIGDMRGRLVIADFGCTEFSTKEEVDREKRNWVPNSPTYRPPEVHLSPHDSSITSSYDMWTLGCVYLEYLTWWFGGWAFVEKFAAQRSAMDPDWYGVSRPNLTTDSFFTITEESTADRNRSSEKLKLEKTAEVKKVVRDFMEHLDSLAKGKEFVQGFLALIQERMLIVESLKEDGTKNGRACAKTVVGELDNMRKKLPREP